MFYTYILYSEKDGKLYIGYSPDLKKRLEKHRNGFVLATKNRRPLELIYYESYLTERYAKNREIFLKGGKGHEELKRQGVNSPRELPTTVRYSLLKPILVETREQNVRWATTAEVNYLLRTYGPDVIARLSQEGIVPGFPTVKDHIALMRRAHEEGWRQE